MFDVIAVECVCQGMRINYSDKIVTVLSVRHFAGDLVMLEMSNSRTKCYQCGKLFRRYL